MLRSDLSSNNINFKHINIKTSTYFLTNTNKFACKNLDISIFLPTNISMMAKKVNNILFILSLFICTKLVAQDEGPEPPPAAIIDNISLFCIAIAILIGFVILLRKNK